MDSLPDSRLRDYPQAVTYQRQLALIGLITLVTLCAGWIGLMMLERRLIEGAGETIAALATDVAEEIDLLWDERYGDLDILAALATSRQTMDDTIRMMQKVRPSYLWIGVADPTGRIMQSTDPSTVGLDVHEREWFRTVMRTSAVSIGHVETDVMTRGLEAVALSAPIVPVREQKKSLKGVVSVRLGLPDMERHIADTIRTYQQRMGLLHNVEYQVARQDGFVFIDSDLFHKGNLNLKRAGIPSMARAEVESQGFIEEPHLRRHVPVVTGFARTKARGNEGARWTVLLRVDRSDVLAPIHIVLWVVVIAGLLIAGPLIGMLVLATRRAHQERIEADDERGRARDNERRLETIFEVDPEGVLVLAQDRRILRMNPAGCTLLAAAFPEEVVGKDLAQFIHAEDRANFERVHDTALQGRGVVAKARLIALSGQVRWVEMTSVLLPDRQQLEPAVLGVIRDVTEQRRSDRRQALQHAVAKVLAGSSSVEQAVPDLLRAITTVLEWEVGLFWQVREDDRVLICTHDWSATPATVVDFITVSRRHTFRSGGGLAGRCWARGEPLWVTDVQQDSEFLRGPAAAMNGLHAACIFPIWLRANVFGVMEFLSHEIHPADAELLRTVGVIGSQIGLFIERTEVEAALRENESRTRLILDTAMDAVIAMDSNGIITEWNIQAETMFGWTHLEAVGRDLADTILPPAHRAAHREALARFCRTGKAVTLNTLMEIAAVHRDGREFPIELAISPLRLDDTVIFSAFIRDITARKESEKALTDYAQQLERINHQLDAALTEAKAATEAKSAFLATMSHEIRTPMNGIIGMTGLLLDTSLTPEQREYGETVRHCGDHLLMLINDILDYSKIEAGKLSLEVIEFDLRVAIEESLELLAERASSKRLNLACLFHADVPRALQGDPGRLRQILMNLVGNALKFTEQGEVVIQVSTDAQSERDATIRIAITDTGIGIPEDIQQKLFQSFSQADGSTTRKYGGTGLGLAICKRLVEMMGGTIGVTSRPGQGSCFWFTACLKKHTTVSAHSEPSETALVGARVLIVDDKATNRQLLEQLTKRWGMAPTLLDGGPAVMDLLERSSQPPPFDVALLDVDMRTTDGLALARAIRARPAWAEVRLVLITSLGRRGDAKAAREAGLAAYLTKPIRESQLYDGLVAVMETPLRADSASSEADPCTPLVTRYSVADAKAKAGLRILLAEDNIINQQVAAHLFDRLGHRVDVVANGLEAVEALARIPYGLVFLDCQMPEMDGFQATAEIRKRDGDLRHTVIIAMTANAMPGDRERCLAAGMDDYVSKPITKEALAGILARWTPADTCETTVVGSMSEAPTIDPHIFGGLRELAGSDAPDFVERLVGQFLEDTSTCLDQMRRAWKDGRVSELCRLAHRLKGSAVNLGALRMAQLCERIRLAAESHEVAGHDSFLFDLEQELARVQARLGWGTVRHDGSSTY